MKTIKASYEILDRTNLDAMRRIENAGRTAYKSENKITETSSTDFFRKMLENKHFPVLEFSNVHVLVECNTSPDHFSELTNNFVAESFPSKYIALSTIETPPESEEYVGFAIISGTVRAFMNMATESLRFSEKGSILHFIVQALNRPNPYFPLTIEDADGTRIVNDEINGVRSMVLPTESMLKIIGHLPRVEKHLMCAVRFICNRAVTHELVRHRPVSFIQESQRYCRYSLDKFGNEVTFIEPTAFFDCPGDYPNEPAFDDKYTGYFLWKRACEVAEETYFLLLDKGNSPQAARTVLPNSCKTEIIMYATIEEWKHIFSLRDDKAAEPSMRELMGPLHAEFFSEENKAKWE